MPTTVNHPVGIFPHHVWAEATPYADMYMQTLNMKTTPNRVTRSNAGAS